MTRPNKLEGLSLETLSSQVLEYDARPEPTQLEHLSDASFLGKLLVLLANVRLDWKGLPGNTLGYLSSSSAMKEKSFIALTPDRRKNFSMATKSMMETRSLDLPGCRRDLRGRPAGNWEWTPGESML